MSCPILVSSVIARTDIKELSFKSDENEFTSGGIVIRNACGSTM